MNSSKSANSYLPQSSMSHTKSKPISVKKPPPNSRPLSPPKMGSQQHNNFHSPPIITTQSKPPSHSLPAMSKSVSHPASFPNSTYATSSSYSKPSHPPSPKRG
eukprot:CAMPEP_0201581906 /NCGR_PEP_ID=MMETSP0190_2-20130828/77089_1 /ASSEMBLY_ACC=CAM_ASM_000263 /TAXON_ID=37353 /ORGANISM="Rosalina sp." /LENGTH=102 /DNA_ID=CAMNT_0048020789 /DNA_START=145 /DNA_END=450 /DNA_ORIENTATION=+